MAITEITALSPVMGVRNPMRWRVEGEHLEVEAVFGYQRILFNVGDMPVDGDTIEFSNNEFELTVTFRNVPDPALPEVLVYTSGSLALYITNVLVPALQSMYHLQFHSVISQWNTGGIEILSRSADPTLQVLAAITGFTPVSDTTLTSVAADQYPNYRILFQLWAEEYYSAGDPQLILEEKYPVDAGGQAVFDVSGPLRSILRPTVPQVGSGGAITLTKSFVRYHTRAMEVHDDQAVLPPMLVSTTQQAHLLGRTQENFMLGELGVVIDPANEASPWDLRFLTAWPNTVQQNARMVTPAQQEYLSFIHPQHVDGLTLKLLADLYYETGDPVTDHQIHIFSGGSTYTYRHLAAPVGIGQCGLELVDGSRRLLHYNVRLCVHDDGNPTVSERRYYKVDRRHHEHVREWLVFNSCGGWDTILLHGRRSTDAKAEIVRSGRYVHDATATVVTVAHNALAKGAGDAAAYLHKLEYEYEAGTTYFTEAEAPALADVLGSELILERVGDQWWPVELTGKATMDLGMESDGIRSRKFTYRYAMPSTALGR
jgi:hypothetical protein